MSIDWKKSGRILLKAGILFVLLNVLFAWLQPLARLGQLSLYNRSWPGRPRLPYGENPAESYNLSLNNLPALFASHEISRSKAQDEFRVVMIGDSGTWGWLLLSEETLAARLNEMALTAGDGRRLVFYNLGYPILSVSKDLLLLEEALHYDPDLILWPVTLESMVPATQLDHPLVQNNPQRLRSLSERYDLALDRDDPRFVDPTPLQQTILGQRRALADLLRLQQLGLVWSATGVDLEIPETITSPRADFESDVTWQAYDAPTSLREDDLALSPLRAGIELAGDIPVLLINEPIFISAGDNSVLHYNAWYPRWAYDSYRDLLTAVADRQAWQLVDLWHVVPAAEFSDSPVHLTPAGIDMFARELLPAIRAQVNE